MAEYSHHGWVYFNDSFYYISAWGNSWQDSREDCLQRGADLVIINSKEEQEFMRQFKKHVWIGLTDRETEGVWEWVDGTPLTTSYWDANEPNSHEGIDEDCGEIKLHYDDENNWNDVSCTVQNIWICEKKFTLTQ
uniref:C-type lectin domain family 4 member E-like n=1 Tax=Semicossyphus pulcher TaxID=241346 RepID=UPI0037E9BDA4